ncbi:MAG: MOFRL family protein [Caldilineaceae bacterium]
MFHWPPICTDGPTDSAGCGPADSGTVARRRRPVSARADHLRRHDAYPFLEATDDLLVTGPTARM